MSLGYEFQIWLGKEAMSMEKDIAEMESRNG